MYEEAYQVLNPGSFLLRTLAAGLGAGALSMIGAFSIPSVLNRVLPLARHDELWTFLPFQRVADDRKTLVMNGNRHMRIIEIEGAELSLTDDARHLELFEARQRFVEDLERLGVDQVKMLTLKQQTKLTRTLKPSNPVLRAVDDQWESKMKKPTRLSHYIIIIAKGKTIEDTAASLDAAETHTMTALVDYRPAVLIEPEDMGEANFDDEESRPHGPLKPFAHALSPITQHSPMGHGYTGPLGALLTGDAVDFSDAGRGIVKFLQGSERRWSSVVTWRKCGDRNTEMVMREITALDYEMIIYHAIEPIDSTKAINTLNLGKMSAKTMHLSANAGPSYEKVLKKVEGYVANERSGLSYYAMHVMPICHSKKELTQAVSDIKNILNRTAGNAVSLNVMAQPTYMSMMDPAQQWPRKFRLNNDNITACLYPQRTLRAPLKSDWCNEPLAWLRAANGDPYPLNLHVSAEKEAVAHVLMIGGTGLGKTTLMTFLAAQAKRTARLRVYLFDRLYGMKVFTTCAGGNYVDFDGASSQAMFNPLHMPDSPSNRTFLLQWLQEITGLTDNRACEEFARTIELNYDRQLPMSKRLLKVLADTAFAPDGEARFRITPWIENNQYGTVFNAEDERLNLLNTSLSGFNMTQMLNDEKLAPAVISYLVHQIQNISMSTSDPSLIFIDETKAMLRNNLFATRFLERGLEEGRKLRQSVVLAFQGPQSMMETGKEQIIMGQCQTQILFRIKDVNDASIAAYRPLGLNTAEMDFLARRTHKDLRHAVLIRRADSESAVVNVDLQPLGKYLKIFKSGTESVNELNGLLQVMPRDLAVKTYLDAA